MYYLNSACSKKIGGRGVWEILKPSGAFEKFCTAANRQNFRLLGVIPRVLTLTCSTDQIDTENRTDQIDMENRTDQIDMEGHRRFFFEGKLPYTE